MKHGSKASVASSVRGFCFFKAAAPDEDGILYISQQRLALAPKSNNQTSDHVNILEENGNLFFQLTDKDVFRDSALSNEQSENLTTWEDLTLSPNWISDAANKLTIKVPVPRTPQKKFNRIKVAIPN